MKAPKHRPCTFPDCGRPAVVHGLCHSHRDQERAGQELRPIGRKGPAQASPALMAAVVREAKSGRSITLQARALGITMSRIAGIRAQARKAGHELPTPRFGNDESPRWKELDQRKATCGTCWLRLPHDECLKPATHYARSGRPAGGDAMWARGET